MISINQTELIKLSDPNDIWDYLLGKADIHFFWLGRQSYRPIWDLQKDIHFKRVNKEIPDVVLFVEHEHVYTFGKNSDTNNLLDSKPRGADVIQIDRGGEVTYHGPGQLVCYPIIDLHNYKKSVSWYMRMLEDIVIDTLKSYGIHSGQKEGLTGVWVADEKICAMGIRLARWVTMHGFAINLNPNMIYFDGIIPCGIFEYGVSSMHAQGVNIDMILLSEKIISSFTNLFLRGDNEV